MNLYTFNVMKHDPKLLELVDNEFRELLRKVSNEQAYEWVKTGHWNLAQFRAWCSAQKEN